MRSFVRPWLATLCCLLVLPALARSQQGARGVVSGTVTDAASGMPIRQAEVSIVGTRFGVITNDSGAYSIGNVPPGLVRVRVQRIGYKPVEQSATLPSGGSITVNVALAGSVVALSEVVTTATGATQVRELGNSVQFVDTAQIQRHAATDPQQILAGSTPGVTVLANSGQPGTGGTIQLRGANSISQGNSPLIYVDGVRVYSGNTPVSGQGRQFENPLNDINADDIDHIEVVEGPSATTLYGTQASNGVIQIFTKHGTTGQHWTAEVAEGFDNMGHVGPSSDPTGLGFNECRGPDLVNGAGVKYIDVTCPASGSWLRDGPVQNLNLGVRGGAGFINYFVEGASNQDAGVLPIGGNRDQSLRANLGFLASPSWHVDINSALTHRRVTFFPDGNNAAGVELNLSRRNGSGFRTTGCSSDASVVCLDNDSIFTLNSTNTTDHFTTGGVITFSPNAKFSNRLALGYDNDNADIVDVRPLGFILTPLGSYSEALWNQQFLSSDFSSTYHQPLPWWRLATTSSVGAQWFDSRIHETDLSSSQFAAPGTPTLTTGAIRNINGVTDTRVVNGGFFGQEEVAWRDVAYLTGGLRVDGNSAFGTSFGLQAYPKASLSYVLSDESFWHVPWVSVFKARFSLGDAGKAPGAFDAVRTWLPVAANNGQPAVTTSSAGNPNLGPERTREVEAGFDATAFSDRLTVNYTYFSDVTHGALVPVQLAPSLGFAGSQLENVGTLMNHGNELQATAQIVRGWWGNFQTRVSYSTVTSEAGNIGGLPITVDAVQRAYVVQGLPVPTYYGIKILNPNAIANPDTAGNQFLGAVFPTKTISLDPTLTLGRRFTVDALGEWQLGGHNLNAVGYVNSNLQDWQPCYAAQAAMKAFAAGNTTAMDNVTALERAKCTLSGTARDLSYWVESANFFKLRSVSVTYDLPPRRLFGWQSASISLAGRNLFTSTSYDGTDPEVSDQTDNQFGRRDYYVFPQFRTFLLTVRVGF